MTDFNSKVDLRPQWMINDNNAHTGKPHIDAVLQPGQRENGIPRAIPKLSPDQLKGVVLKKTGTRSSIDSEGTRTKDDIQSLRVVHKDQAASKDTTNDRYSYTSDTERSTYTAIPAPPPPPPINHFQPQLTPTNRARIPPPSHYPPHDYEPKNRQDFSELLQKEKELNDLKAKFNQLEKSLMNNGNDDSHISPQNQPIRRNHYEHDSSQNVTHYNNIPQRPRVDSGVELNRTFDERELKNENMNKWMEQMINDKFDRLSRIDTINDEPQRPPFYQPRPRPESKTEDRYENRTRRSSSRKSRRAISPTRSQASSKGSIKSVAKSIKSVLFKSTEEAELLSEVDDDDIADVNAGKTDFVDLTSEKFTIHGPFVDKELNVFHAICREYEVAAKISFAKRTPFARTNPAHERVYALIGSNKRTGWTNRNSWSNATNDLQVLDYIFRRTIRSNSRKIRKPVMELEHFTEGTILDTRRFWKIMKGIFKKRERLAQVLNTNTENFEDIK